MILLLSNSSLEGQEISCPFGNQMSNPVIIFIAMTILEMCWQQIIYIPSHKYYHDSEV
jgi:hypothetical protein